MPKMKLSDIARIRLLQQKITGKKYGSAKDTVHWMGAMQAQDYAMAKWAVGIRTNGATVGTVQSALDKGEILRTHVLRPTWHFVSSDDIYWMLELTAPHLLSSLKARQRELELTAKVLEKCQRIFEMKLKGHCHTTRDELKHELTKAKIRVDNNRSSHIFLWAESEGILCSGADKNGKQTYALLPERVPKPGAVKREDALAHLARRYFMSHGPATLQDFTWWSGLPVGDARNALEMIKPDVVSETIGSHTYWRPSSLAIPKKENSTHLLPAFDEYLISYKDRSAALSLDDHKKSVSNNGIFWPVVVINGQVTGRWKRSVKKGKVIIETEYFRRHSKSELNWIEKAANTFSEFYRPLEGSHDTQTNRSKMG
jgi:hypothetical protein